MKQLKCDTIQGIWSILLWSADFKNAFTTGLIICCGNGQWRWLFPCFFAYSADYVERYCASILSKLALWINTVQKGSHCVYQIQWQTPVCHLQDDKRTSTQPWYKIPWPDICLPQAGRFREWAIKGRFGMQENISVWLHCRWCCHWQSPKGIEDSNLRMFIFAVVNQATSKSDLESCLLLEFIQSTYVSIWVRLLSPLCCGPSPWNQDRDL